MRLSSENPNRKLGSTVHSFYEDWRSLGNLVAQLLSIPSINKPEEPYRADPASNTDFLYASERDLLRMLITADPLARLDADVVGEQLDRISPTLEQQRVGSEAKLVLALRLDALQEFSKAIREASGRTIELGDYSAQLKFVADALADSPVLVKVKGRNDGPDAYRLRPYPMTRGGETTWSLAIADRVLRDKPAQAEILSDRRLEGWEIDIIDMGEARNRAPRLQGKTTRWDSLIKAEKVDPTVSALRNRSYAALMLVQVADLLWQATQIWPVGELGLKRPGQAQFSPSKGETILLCPRFREHWISGPRPRGFERPCKMNR